MSFCHHLRHYVIDLPFLTVLFTKENKYNLNDICNAERKYDEIIVYVLLF